jgi:hypothetical protein
MMSDKIYVTKIVDAENQIWYTVSARTLGELADSLGVAAERLHVKKDSGQIRAIRAQRLRELNRMANTPDALRQREMDHKKG